jgi:hypothetical protein
MSEPAEETKDTAKKMSLGGIGKSLLGGAKSTVIKTVDFLHKKFGSAEHIDEGKKLSNTEYLGEIFKMMKVMDEDKKLNHEMANNHLKEEEHKKDIRNKEIIQALTGKKFKKTKFKSKLKSKTKKKITAAKVSESVGGLSLGTLGTLGAIGIGTAAVVGTGAVLMSATSSSAFANTMKMEQSVGNRQSALDKAHEATPDTDNSLSYGVIGLSSRRGKSGTKKSSLDSFIEDNPEFGLPDPGNGGHDEKFRKKWNEIPSDKLLEAQEKWYQKHVYDPTVRTIEKTGVDPKVASDERVRVYMADRAAQIGTDGTEPSIKNSGAAQSKTAEEFIDKMADYDIKNLDNDFPNYLKQHPENRNGLIKRVERRKKLSLGMNPNNETKGTKKLYPKQSSSAKSENLEIKDKESSITDEQLEKQRLEYEKQAENGMDMGYKLKYPEQKSSNAQNVTESQRKSAGLESTGPMIPKSTTALSAAAIELLKRIEAHDERELRQKEEDNKLFTKLREIQAESDKLILGQMEDERIENISKSVVTPKLIYDTSPQNPVNEDSDNRVDGPVTNGTSIVIYRDIEVRQLPTAQGKK